MAYGLSNGHVTDEFMWLWMVTWRWRHGTPKGAVRQYGQLSQRQLGFLFLIRS